MMLACQAEAEARRKREVEAAAKREREAEAKRKREAEAKRKREAEAKAEEDRRRRVAEAEAKRRADAEAKRRAEAEAKRRAEAEAAARRRALVAKLTDAGLELSLVEAEKSAKRTTEILEEHAKNIGSKSLHEAQVSLCGHDFEFKEEEVLQHEYFTELASAGGWRAPQQSHTVV